MSPLSVVFLAIMTALVRLTHPARLVEEARHHPETAGGHEHESMVIEGDNLWQKLRHPRARVVIAQNFAMDWSMLWKDLLAGFLIAGALSAFVPAGVWKALFLTGASPWVQVPVNALIGPLIAVVSFVCSIGNVPMAAVLWGSGISFGGVLSFLYADLIVIPLLDADTVPCVDTVCRANAVTPPATWRSGVVASGTRSTKLVLMPLKPVVCALAMLPEMFCSANDCACKPPTEVLSASKIPMTSSPDS